MSERYEFTGYTPELFEFTCEDCGAELSVTVDARCTHLEIIEGFDWTRIDTGEDYLYFCPECTEASNEQAYQGSL